MDKSINYTVTSLVEIPMIIRFHRDWLTLPTLLVVLVLLTAAGAVFPEDILNLAGISDRWRFGEIKYRSRSRTGATVIVIGLGTIGFDAVIGVELSEARLVDLSEDRIDLELAHPQREDQYPSKGFDCFEGSTGGGDGVVCNCSNTLNCRFHVRLPSHSLLKSSSHCVSSRSNPPLQTRSLHLASHDNVFRAHPSGLDD
ncbi:hypothetical protein C8J56DRAFT_984272 [Mycena floridula]|nr:hypothetical protein C8J56DRAFT_984272 [Mycena floridula]